MSRLYEDSRTGLLSKSKNADNYAPDNQEKGRNRFKRRLSSKMSPSVQEYNNIDMNKLFKENILDVRVRVKGETDDYLVQISFGGFLHDLQRQLINDSKIDLRKVTRALIATFNGDAVYVRCNCPDFRYRQAYWLSKANAIAGDPETRPSDETNPNDTKGRGCKHILLCLSNNTWLIKVASVVTNYINYMEEHYPKLYADVIYPAIYNKKYEEPVQLDFDTLSSDELDSSEDTIDISNNWARTKNQFKQGNDYGVRFTSKQPDKQMNFDSLLSDN